jgi:hypothetical protein
VQCRDAKWPRNWGVWHRDNVAVAKKAPFMAWNNAWYNAPCAFWPTSSLQPVNVANSKLPPVLLFQATLDAATPFPGGVKVHRLIKGSKLVVEVGGGNHGITLSGNTCLDGYLARYLGTGALPTGHGLVNATCAKLPDPTPPKPVAAAPAAGAAKSSGVRAYVNARV